MGESSQKNLPNVEFFREKTLSSLSGTSFKSKAETNRRLKEQDGVQESSDQIGLRDFRKSFRSLQRNKT